MKVEEVVEQDAEEGALLRVLHVHATSYVLEAPIEAAIRSFYTRHTHLRVLQRWMEFVLRRKRHEADDELLVRYVQRRLHENDQHHPTHHSSSLTLFPAWRLAHLRAAFAHWRHALYTTQQHADDSLRATVHATHALALTSFAHWLRLTQLRRADALHDHAARTFATHRHLRRVLRAWHTVVVADAAPTHARHAHLLDTHLRTHAQHQLARTFATWRRRTLLLSRTRYHARILDLIARHQHLVAALATWRTHASAATDLQHMLDRAHLFRQPDAILARLRALPPDTRARLEHHALARWRRIVLDQKAARLARSHVRQRARMSVATWARRALVSRMHRAAHSAASAVHRARVQRKTFATWRHALVHHRAQTTLDQRAAAFHSAHARRSAIAHWFAIAARTRRTAELDLVARQYREWHMLSAGVLALHARVDATHHAHTHRRLERFFRFHLALHAWTRHVHAARRHWTDSLAAKRHAFLLRLRRTFSAWGTQTVVERAREDTMLQQAARPFFVALQRQLFHVWRARLAQRRHDHSLTLIVQARWHHRVLVATLHHWHASATEQLHDRVRCMRADAHRERLVRRDACARWRSFVVRSRSVRAKRMVRDHAATRYAAALCTRQVWFAWRRRHAVVQYDRALIDRATVARHVTRVKRSVGVWRRFVAARQALAVLRLSADTLFATRLLQCAFGQWKVAQHDRRVALHKHVAALHMWSSRLYRMVWAAWWSYVEHRRGKRERYEHARTLRQRKLQVEGCRQWLRVAMEVRDHRREARVEGVVRDSLRVQEVVWRCAQRWRRRALARADSASTAVVVKVREREHEREGENGRNVHWPSYDDVESLQRVQRAPPVSRSMQAPREVTRLAAPSVPMDVDVSTLRAATSAAALVASVGAAVVAGVGASAVVAPPSPPPPLPRRVRREPRLPDEILLHRSKRELVAQAPTTTATMWMGQPVALVADAARAMTLASAAASASAAATAPVPTSPASSTPSAVVTFASPVIIESPHDSVRDHVHVDGDEADDYGDGRGADGERLAMVLAWESRLRQLVHLREQHQARAADRKRWMRMLEVHTTATLEALTTSGAQDHADSHVAGVLSPRSIDRVQHELAEVQLADEAYERDRLSHRQEATQLRAAIEQAVRAMQ